MSSNKTRTRTSQNGLISGDAEKFVTIGSHFEAVVARFRTKVAIQTAEKDVSYDNLNKQVNQIAHLVHDFSKGEHNRIGLLFEQGSDAIASMFGVLKAGCAFVPLDNAHPEVALIEICQDCSPVLILTDHQELAERIVQDKVPIIDITQLPAGLPETNPSLYGKSNTTAYLFYTSGSTGKPKGVCQTQRNLFHFVRVYSNTLGISHRDRLSLLYSLAFSASNMDVFGALLNGATLCLYNVRKRGTAWLADWIDTCQISILHTVPTVFRHLTENMEDDRILDSVEGIDLGGEPVFVSDVALFKQHFKNGCIFINHLAATEASVMSQYHIDPEAVFETEILPVGYAADGVMIEILDKDGNKAPTGQTGELVVHSQYVSSGYWNMPDLNQEVFSEGEHLANRRLYRTGDLGCIDEDGKIYFLGRKDYRIKVHGYSVDTNEVESIIRRCTPWKDVAVVARSLEKVTSKQLVAFIVKNGDVKTDMNQVRNSLSHYLPSYKVPSEFIALDVLPENASGKIDRKTLAKLDLREKDIQREYTAPEDEIEQTIAELCQFVLKLELVGRHDGFFNIGGNSLLALELHLLVDAAFPEKIPLQLLFTETTVAGMASVVKKIVQRKSDSHDKQNEILVPLRKTGSNPILFLVHGINGQAFVSPNFLKIIGDSQPLYAIQASGLDHPLTGHKSIEEMAANYISAIQDVQPKGPYFIGGLCVGGIVALEMSNQLCSIGEEVGPLLMIDPPDNTQSNQKRMQVWYSRVKQLLTRKKPSRNKQEKMISHLTKKAEQGRISLDASSKNALENAVQIGLGFQLALADYQIKPYDGKILLLASQNRITKRKGEIRKNLAGEVTIFNIGKHHRDVHDVSNKQFSEALCQSIKIAQKDLQKT